MADAAKPTPQHEDERMRVTRWDFEPGTTTGHHVHEYAYVVVPVTDGLLEVHGPDGTVTPFELRAGESYARPAGVEHEIVNAAGHVVSFVEIELKENHSDK